MVESDSSHRKSVAWQKSMAMARAIYLATQKFPADERFGLTNQLRRASVSVASNIAEGKGRLTTGELLHFLGMARGSALEVQTQLELATTLKFGEPSALENAFALSTEVVRILNASIATLRAKVAARKSS